MGKDTHLLNIYLKIHNKRPLTMLDLKYLAKDDPECFEKTCKNVVYNVPEAKAVMEPLMKPLMKPTSAENTNKVVKVEELKQKSIQQILDNIKALEKLVNCRWQMLMLIKSRLCWEVCTWKCCSRIMIKRLL